MSIEFSRRCATVAVALVALLVVAGFPAAVASPTAQISAGSERVLQKLLRASDAVSTADPSTRAELISRQLLGTPYGANTLVGSADQPEQLVVELQRVDCFTYADYVEAAKRSPDRDAFMANLVDVRYTDGIVAFPNRKHFFTDWAATTPAVATDVTASLSDAALPVAKTLNAKSSGGLYLPGLPTVARTVTYLPSAQVDADVIGRLRTGDYLGAYATDSGLDVTHVGIFVAGANGPMFRNASSITGVDAVVDTPLSDYLSTVPGIVVLRPVV